MENDTVRSCSGCITFQCAEASADRNEFFWNIGSATSVNKHCCLSCKGKVFPEGSEMEVSASESGSCTTDVTTSCLYNPGILTFKDGSLFLEIKTRALFYFRLYFGLLHKCMILSKKKDFSNIFG